MRTAARLFTMTFTLYEDSCPSVFLLVDLEIEHKACLAVLNEHYTVSIQHVLYSTVCIYSMYNMLSAVYCTHAIHQIAALNPIQTAGWLYLNCVNAPTVAWLSLLLLLPVFTRRLGPTEGAPKQAHRVSDHSDYPLGAYTCTVGWSDF